MSDSEEHRFRKVDLVTVFINSCSNNRWVDYKWIVWIGRFTAEPHASILRRQVLAEVLIENQSQTDLTWGIENTEAVSLGSVRLWIKKRQMDNDRLPLRPCCLSVLAERWMELPDNPVWGKVRSARLTSVLRRATSSSAKHKHVHNKMVLLSGTRGTVSLALFY